MKNFSSVIFLAAIFLTTAYCEVTTDTPIILNPRLAATDPSFTGIAFYLYPNALIGILFSLFILSILIYGFLLMMELQTPTVFSNDKIDFGKIEK